MSPTAMSFALREFSPLHFFVEIPSRVLWLHNHAFLNTPHPPSRTSTSMPNPVFVMATEQHPAPLFPSLFSCFSQCFCSKDCRPPSTCSCCCGWYLRLKYTCMLNTLSGNRHSTVFKHVQKITQCWDMFMARMATLPSLWGVKRYITVNVENTWRAQWTVMYSTISAQGEKPFGSCCCQRMCAQQIWVSSLKEERDGSIYTKLKFILLFGPKTIIFWHLNH